MAKLMKDWMSPSTAANYTARLFSKDTAADAGMEAAKMANTMANTKDDIGSSEPDDEGQEEQAKQPQKKKKGGKVHGAMPKQRLDKRARGGGSGIHIKPENKGKFTAKAKAAGKGVQEYAREEKDAGGKLGKEANFALNAKKFKH